jgi:hypothetical protein
MVVALYQHCCGELVLWEHGDVKQHWIKKCCNKFKKPTGNPGDPWRFRILRFQRIHQRIPAKISSVVMGMDSGGDNGLELVEEEAEVVEVTAQTQEKFAVAGYQSNSRTSMPITFVDGAAGDGGIGVLNPEGVGVPPVPPLPPVTHNLPKETVISMLRTTPMHLYYHLAVVLTFGQKLESAV